MIRRTKLLAAAAPLLAAAAMAAPAGAATYCVHQPGDPCAAGSIDKGADLNAALGAAAKANDADVVRIGPGKWTGTFGYAGAGPLQIVGSGPDTTHLVGKTGPASVVLQAFNATVSDLHVHLTSAASWRGVVLGGKATARNVLVDGDAAPAGARTGVLLAGEASLEQSVVDLDEHKDEGVHVDVGPGIRSVVDSSVHAWIGVDTDPSADGVAVVRRSTIRGGAGIIVDGSSLFADNTVIRVVLPSGGIGAVSQCEPGHPASLVADHLTVLGAGVQGLDIVCGSSKASAYVRNTFVDDGFTAAFSREAFSGGTSDLDLAFSDLDVATAKTSGSGTTKLASNIHVAPGFAADGERLAPGSELVDAGEPGDPAEDVDRDTKARKIGARQDIGAYELAPAAPAPPADTAAPAPDASSPPTVTPSETVPPLAGVSDDALIAELRRTLRDRKGRRFTHTWLVPGSLRIVFVARGRVVAKVTAKRTAAGTAKLRVKPTRRGRRVLKRKRLRVSVRASFVRAGQTAKLTARRRAVLRHA